MIYRETSALWPREANSRKEKNQFGIEQVFDHIIQTALIKQKDEPVVNKSIKLNVKQIYACSEQPACVC